MEPGSLYQLLGVVGKKTWRMQAVTFLKRGGMKEEKRNVKWMVDRAVFSVTSS